MAWGFIEITDRFRYVCGRHSDGRRRAYFSNRSRDKRRSACRGLFLSISVRSISVLSISLLSISTLLTLLFSASLYAAPKAELWPFWQEAPSGAAADSALPGFESWQSFLDQYVKRDVEGLHRVAYADVGKQQRKILRDHLDGFSDVDPRSWSDPEQQAFWINVYNMSVVNLALDHYPVDSIKDIRLSFKSLFNGGPWEDKLIEVAGKKLSLNDIEHRILRPIWKDSRFHFALNCASIGCPNLALEVYKPEVLDQQLNQARNDFLQSKRAFEANEEGVRLSSIFKWYWQDFAPDEALLWRYFETHGLLTQEVKRFSFDYDWRLNKQHEASDSPR